MLEFFGHFLISLLFVAGIALLIMAMSDLISMSIKTTVDDRFRKLEERLRERLEHERESEKRQRDHEERLRQIREGGTSAST